MLTFLARNWWALVVRGIAAVLFGVVAFVWPGITLAALVILWGAYALVDGVVALVAVFSRRREEFPWWLLLTALAGILAGIFTFISPALTAIALLYLVAAFAVVRGVTEIAAAIRLRKEIENEWVLGLAGVASLVFGALIIAFPGPAAVAIVIWIGAAAIVIGFLEIALGIRVRKRISRNDGSRIGEGA